MSKHNSALFLISVGDTMIQPWRLEQDIDAIINQVGDNWNHLRGSRIFVTGGTGFIGRWILESLRVADERYSLNIQTTIISRNPNDFTLKAPHIGSYKNFRFISGDVNNFVFPQGEFTHLIHAATDASADLNEHDPRRMFDTVLLGTRHVLDFAVEKKISKILYLSSGAVYGAQPWEITNVSEEYRGAPDCTNAVNAYAEGKRAAEMLCSIYAKQFGLYISTARIFALLGPLLSLDIHFAAGNFIRDAIEGKKIIVKGNGAPCRSYLYISDLIIYLWYLLIKGSPGIAYNVGSNDWISIRDLAERVATLIGRNGYEVLGREDRGWNQGRYAPDITKISTDFGFHPLVSLDEAIIKTAMWNGWKPCH